MSEIKISPVVYGKSTLPESECFLGGAADKKRPILFMIYLIRTEGKLILADAGCETMPGFVMEDFCGPVAALNNMGVAAEDITDIVITHAHHDHIECVKDFKNARVFIQRDEYENGRSYIPEGTNTVIFDDSAEVAPGITAKKIGGHSIGSCVVEICAEGKTTVLAGDECYLRECLDRQIPTGRSFSAEKSREFVLKYSSDEYRVLLCHDI